MTEFTNLPLEGVLVLDLSRVLAGPCCTMMLGDLGARVVKVEHPEDGDVTRGWGPPYDAEGESAYFQSINRNKESIALDLATADGRRAVEILAGRADVLVENFAPGALDRFGISLDALRRSNPRLVTASITGFGPVGPERSVTGFDLLAQAAAGLMSVTGDPDGPPQKVGVAVSDIVSGCYLAVGVLASLAAREKTGRGGSVETDLFSSTLALLANYTQACLMSGIEARRFGKAHGQIVPYQMFSTRNGELVLAVGTDRQYRNLCERVLERPDLSADKRFSTNAARVENRASLIPVLESAFSGNTTEHWIDSCRKALVPAGPVRGPLAAMESGQAEALGLVRNEQGFRAVASPIRIAGSDAPFRRPPRLGEHTEALKKEFRLP